jgi:hypothetical protein
MMTIMLPTAKNATNSIKATNMLIHFQNAQIATNMMAFDGRNDIFDESNKLS